VDGNTTSSLTGQHIRKQGYRNRSKQEKSTIPLSEQRKNRHIRKKNERVATIEMVEKSWTHSESDIWMLGLSRLLPRTGHAHEAALLRLR